MTDRQVSDDQGHHITASRKSATAETPDPPGRLPRHDGDPARRLRALGHQVGGRGGHPHGSGPSRQPSRPDHCPRSGRSPSPTSSTRSPGSRSNATTFSRRTPGDCVRPSGRSPRPPPLAGQGHAPATPPPTVPRGADRVEATPHGPGPRRHDPRQRAAQRLPTRPISPCCSPTAPGTSQVLPGPHPSSFTSSGASGTAPSPVLLTGRRATDSWCLNATTTTRRDGFSFTLKSRASVVEDQCPSAGSSTSRSMPHDHDAGWLSQVHGPRHRDVSSTVHASSEPISTSTAAALRPVPDTSRVLAARASTRRPNQVVEARGSIALGTTPTFHAVRVNLVRSSSGVGLTDRAHVSGDGLGSALQLGIGARGADPLARGSFAS